MGDRASADSLRWNLDLILDQRGADMVDVPGGASGLLVRGYKGKEADRLVTRIDPGVVSRVAELRGHERQAAEELEQWKTGVEAPKPLDVSPAAITLAMLMTPAELEQFEKNARNWRGRRWSPRRDRRSGAGARGRPGGGPNRPRGHLPGEEAGRRRSLRVFVEQAWPVPEPGTPFVPGVHVDAVCLYLWAMIRNCGRSVAEGWESAKLGWRTLFRLRRDYERFKSRRPSRILPFGGRDRCGDSTADGAGVRRTHSPEITPPGRRSRRLPDRRR